MFLHDYGGQVEEASGAVRQLSSVFGIVWINMTMSSAAPAFVPLIGVVIILIGIGMGVYTFMKAGEYEAAFQRFQRRRAVLVEQYGARGPE